MLMIERSDLETGTVESVITLDEAIENLVPAYYIDREIVEHELLEGGFIKTPAFEYRKAKATATVVAELRF